MSDIEKKSYSCGCGGCFSLILTILVLWALIYGLPTSWGILNIDIFPPGVYLAHPQDPLAPIIIQSK